MSIAACIQMKLLVTVAARIVQAITVEIASVGTLSPSPKTAPLCIKRKMNEDTPLWLLKVKGSTIV
jgi:hypothetical protein